MDLFTDSGEASRRYGQYVDDLRRLLVFHGMSCGAPENFGMLRMKLADSNAFRTDVSALVRSIRDMEKGAISADEMLTIIALASAGEAFVEGRVGSGGSRSTVEMLRIFLAGVGGWKETVEVEENGARSPSPTDSRQQSGQSSNEMAARVVPVLDSYTPGASNVLTRDPDLSEVTARLAAAPAMETAARQPSAVGALKDNGEAATFVLNRRSPDLKYPARTDIPPAPAAGSTDSQRAVTEAAQSFARKLAAGLALQSKEPEEGPSAADERAGDPSQSATPLFEAAEEVIAFPAPAGKSAPEQPKRLVLTSPEPADTLPVISAAEQQKGLGAITEEPAHTSRKEKAGRLLGIAAVLLAGMGLIGLAITLRSSPKPTNSSAGEIGGNTRAPQITPVSPAPNEPTPKGGERPGTSESTKIPASPEASSNAKTAQTRSDVPVGAGNIQPSADRSVAAPAHQPARGAGTAKSKQSMDLGRVTGEPSTLKAAVPRPAEVPASNQSTRGGKSGIAPATGEGARGDRLQGGASTPASSTSAGTRVVVPEAAMRRNLISSRPPVYPPDALKGGVTGTVVLNAFIARDGTVKRMDVVRGPSVFIKSAMSAVSWRRYKPYLVRGKPVEVETPITVSYAPE